MLINKSIEVSSSSDSELLEPTPESIPASLWNRRKDFGANGRPVTDEEVMQLIHEGNNPDDVFLFYDLLKSQKISSNSGRKSKRDTSPKYLACCGYLCHLPISRVAINDIFPGNDSLIYVIVGSVFVFSMTYTLYFVSNVFLFKWYLPFIYGTSVYAFLHPPESEPYSTSTGEIENGITRVAWFSFIHLLQYILVQLSNSYPIISIPYFEFTFRISEYSQFISDNLNSIIELLLVWIHFFIGLPSVMFHWFIESVNVYLFGSGCSSNVTDSLIQFIKSIFLFIGIQYIHGLFKENVSYSLSIFLASLIYQIPTHNNVQISEHRLRYFLFILTISIFSMLSFQIGFTLDPYILSWIIAPIGIFLGIIIPIVSSNSQYYLFHFRILNQNSSLIRVLNLVIPTIIAPILISLAIQKTTMPFWFIILTLLCITNNSLSESANFSLSLCFFLLFFNYDYHIPDYCFKLFVSHLVSRKLFNIIEHLRFSRLFRFYFMTSSEESSGIILSSLINPLYKHFPFIDRLFQIPSVFWSFLTGAAINSPGLVTFWMFPAHPRSSSFWPSIGNELEARVSFSTGLTEHPIETPVYTSLTRALTHSLAPLISSGRVGVVDTGDIFLMMSDTMAAFVHIISFGPHYCTFQLRGLEYNNETSCHRGEMTALKNVISQYDDKGNFVIALIHQFVCWEVKALSVPLSIYDVHSINANNGFTGIDILIQRKLFNYCFAYSVFHSPCIEKQDGIMTSDCPGLGALNVFNTSILDYQIELVIKVYNALFESLMRGNSVNIDNLFRLFNSDCSPIVTSSEFHSNIFEEIIYPTARLTLSVCCLASMQLAIDVEDPNLSNQDISDFFHDFEESYFTCTISSPEFESHFQEEKLDLITISDSPDAQKILFFKKSNSIWNFFSINRESVRTAWQSEAFSQMYCGENDSERASIQREENLLHNLIVQSCNHPLGYPALVSPVLVSYDIPTNQYDFQ